jgi:hypothetical protein
VKEKYGKNYWLWKKKCLQAPKANSNNLLQINPSSKNKVDKINEFFCCFNTNSLIYIYKKKIFFDIEPIIQSLGYYICPIRIAPITVVSIILSMSC